MRGATLGSTKGTFRPTAAFAGAQAAQQSGKDIDDQQALKDILGLAPTLAKQDAAKAGS
eukprot:gene18418-53620_t